MNSEDKIYLLGRQSDTGEDLDIQVTKQIQITCGLCGINNCRHIESIPDEDFEVIVDCAFPSWKRKLGNWVCRNKRSILFLNISILMISIAYTIWWYVK